MNTASLEFIRTKAYEHVNQLLLRNDHLEAHSTANNVRKHIARIEEASALLGCDAVTHHHLAEWRAYLAGVDKALLELGR